MIVSDVSIWDQVLHLVFKQGWVMIEVDTSLMVAFILNFTILKFSSGRAYYNCTGVCVSVSH